MAKPFALHYTSHELIVDVAKVIEDGSIIVDHRSGRSSSVHHLPHLCDLG